MALVADQITGLSAHLSSRRTSVESEQDLHERYMKIILFVLCKDISSFSNAMANCKIFANSMVIYTCEIYRTCNVDVFAMDSQYRLALKEKWKNAFMLHVNKIKTICCTTHLTTELIISGQQRLFAADRGYGVL